MKLGTEVGLGPGHIVLDGDPAPTPQKRHSPQFSAHVCCYGQTARSIRMPLGTEVGLGAGDIVLDGDPAPPPPEREHSTTSFGPCLLCQTVGLIKMKLGTDVGLGPRHIVLDGDPAPSPQRTGHSPRPIFGPCLMWPNGWMDQDATWYGGRPRSGPVTLC